MSTPLVSSEKGALQYEWRARFDNAEAAQINNFCHESQFRVTTLSPSNTHHLTYYHTTHVTLSLWGKKKKKKPT